MTDTAPSTKTDVTERAAVLAYELNQQLCTLLRGMDGETDDVVHGIILGTAMFCDDRIGPFRADKLLRLAISITLRTDARVTQGQLDEVRPMLRAIGEHIARL